ncbi:hypothetical protein ALC57_01416 [Trachymyrmex cornetzi]|uniref:Uncharacterized protein n=1 Tax=Trachymyrmex cornetzi TaxID=471704 RepID=A0A151JPX8_9HYME|nr:hypothetical protein ALC57_01416 [Trachymyrmex cornetzi]
MDTYHFPASRIFNMDETGISTVQETDRVGSEGTKTCCFYHIRRKRENYNGYLCNECKWNLYTAYVHFL